MTFGVGFAALNTGNNLLYLVLSLMLAFLVLSGVLSESSLRGISVRRRLPRELFAGSTGRVTLEISNCQRRIPALAIVVEDRVCERGVERAAGRAFALRIGPGETERRSYRLTPSHRGSFEFKKFQVFTRYPFGLFSKSRTISADSEGLAYPAVEPVSAPADFGAARDDGDKAEGARGHGSESAGLRPFAVGDSVKHVHWRASVRRRELLVREVENEQDSEVEVRLRTAGVAEDAQFESTVSWAASEIVALLDAGLRVSLHTDRTRIDAASGLRQRARLLGFLARVSPSEAEAAP